MSESAASESHSEKPEVVRLPGAHVPADQGLSSLGLLLQLGGGLSAALVSFIGFSFFFNAFIDDTAPIAIFLLTAASLARSLMHRAAGSELLYGAHGWRSLRRYISVGLLHAVVMTAAFIGLQLTSFRVAIGVGIALATWPLILAALLRMPRLRRFEVELPTAEDKGFEGASVLMTILSIVGGSAVAVLLKETLETSAAAQGFGALIVLTLALLLIRSVIHLAAGITGLGNAPLDLVVERVGRYANLGIISAFVASAVLLMNMMGNRADITSMLIIALAGWTLAIWPLTVRRFFSERQFASLLAGEADPIHRRAPDAGLTSLGWLLICLGGISLSVVIGVAFAGSALATSSWRLPPSLLAIDGVVTAGVIAGLQLISGVALLGMGPRHRSVTTAAAVAIVVLLLVVVGPERIADSIRADSLATLFGSLAIMLPLLAACATVALVHRKIAPVAQARVRRPARAAD